MAAPLLKKVSDSQTSAFKKYQQLFVGSQSLAALLRYELLTMLLQAFPGAMGIYLRSRMYRSLLASSGKNVFWGRNVTLRAPSRIRLGNHVIVDDNAVLDAKGEKGFIRCGDEIEISRNTILSCKQGGSITLGNFVSIGRNVLLSAAGPIAIGNDCNIGPFSCLLAAGHGWSDPDAPFMLQPQEIKGIEVGDNVWIGAHVTVMDGVRIGDHSLIAAGSVVSDNIPSYRIAAGMPARAIVRRDAASAPGPVAAKDAPNAGADTGRAVEASKVRQIVCQAIDEVNLQLPPDRKLAKKPRSRLYSGSQDSDGGLDSLGLLNLIVTAEQLIEDAFDRAVSLADNASADADRRPFQTVDSLVQHIEATLKGL